MGIHKGVILDVVYAFLVLVPGFLTYRIGRYVGKVTVPVDRYNKTAYTLISSGLAISLLVISYVLITRRPPASIVEVEYSIAELSLAYLILLVIASADGFLIGLMIDKVLKGDIKARREKAWEITFRNAEQPIEARVITTNGAEIHGYIEVFDTNEHGKDLLLKYPQRIISKDGSVVREISLGTYAYVNEIDISHIYFETDIDVPS